MADALHICKPGDTTETLCELKAARVAAINFSERTISHGLHCVFCEQGYQKQRELDKENPKKG